MKSSTHPLVNIPTLSAIKAKPSLQLGLSLIELMISITIGLLILVALSTLFINQSKARVELDKSNRMIDNGRYALDLLSDNLRLAGYYGEFVPATGIPAIPASLPDPCSTSAADMAAALQLAVQGYEAASPTSSISSPPCGLTYTTGNELLTMKPGSDILVIRRASTATPTVYNSTSALNGIHYLQVSQCQYDLTPYKIDTVVANFTLRQKTCTPTSTTPYADLRQFVVQVYFVSPNNKVIGGVGDGIPTLKRRELDPVSHIFVTTPLVEGIEFMQLEYGLDANNDGVADSYVAAPAATDWPNVVSVKMRILARNTEATQSYTDTKTYSLGLAGSVPPPNDPYKRHAYTQYIRLVNVAGRREVQ
jgi:type IV pilus assembly protein PilW